MSDNKPDDIFKFHSVCLAISQSMSFNGLPFVIENPITILTSVFLPFNTLSHDFTLKKSPDEPGE
ncbi:Uncharacterised protein [Enterobacter hormaechei]|nr:Uncharacterised protein [Enterobacter hormaechei]